MERQRERDTERQRNIYREWHGDRKTDQRDRETERQIRETERQRDRESAGQKNRETGRHRKKGQSCVLCCCAFVYVVEQQP